MRRRRAVSRRVRRTQRRSITQALQAFFHVNFFAASHGTALAQADGIGVIVFLVLVGLCIVGIFIFTVLAIVISAQRRGNRAAKLKTVARQLGFSFTQKPAAPDYLRGTRFAQWFPAVGTGVHNFLQGAAGGRPVVVFDFGYTRTMGGYGSATYRETVMCVPRGDAPPFIFFRERTLVPPEQVQTFLGEGLRSLQEGERRQSLARTSA